MFPSQNTFHHLSPKVLFGIAVTPMSLVRDEKLLPWIGSLSVKKFSDHTADILQLSAHIHGNYHCTPCRPCQPCRICTKVAAKQHQFCTSVLCLTCAEHEGCHQPLLSYLLIPIADRGARLSLLIFLILKTNI